MLEKLNEKLAAVRQGQTNAREKIKMLDKQHEQTVANLNAFIGAEQVLLQLIEEINAEDNKESGVAEVENADN